ncbi:hypothetical protein CDAR_238021 [Caerostris darwini]|uniref:Uncharacterized protein n=1 Tax=Caerostris darwini TaxID=1538125 RepID=A0AAV4S0Q1_9ARAC|nr:hypothetical protein CDAR_238021 [Caerostris darwini]
MQNAETTVDAHCRRIHLCSSRVEERLKGCLHSERKYSVVGLRTSSLLFMRMTRCGLSFHNNHKSDLLGGPCIGSLEFTIKDKGEKEAARALKGFSEVQGLTFLDKGEKEEARALKGFSEVQGLTFLDKGEKEEARALKGFSEVQGLTFLAICLRS